MSVITLNIELVLVFGVGVSVVVVLWRRTHFLIVLMALDVLIVFLIVVVMVEGLNSGDYSEALVFVLLTMGVCEGSLGLSLLVAMVRAHGNDLINSVSVYNV